MDQEIRLATEADIPQVMEVIADAKELFKSQGSVQWQDADGYPHEGTIRNDLLKSQLFISLIKDKVVGMIAILRDEDKNYKVIYDGEWISDKPYYTIHRLAVRKGYYGQHIAYNLIEFAKKKAKDDGIASVRADTMVENMQMRGLLKKCGFTQCGKVILDSKCADPSRLAFEILV